MNLDIAAREPLVFQVPRSEKLGDVFLVTLMSMPMWIAAALMVGSNFVLLVPLVLAGLWFRWASPWGMLWQIELGESGFRLGRQTAIPFERVRFLSSTISEVAYKGNYSSTSVCITLDSPTMWRITLSRADAQACLVALCDRCHGAALIDTFDHERLPIDRARRDEGQHRIHSYWLWQGWGSLAIGIVMAIGLAWFIAIGGGPLKLSSWHNLARVTRFLAVCSAAPGAIGHGVYCLRRARSRR